MKLKRLLGCFCIALTCPKVMAYSCSVATTPLSFGVVEGRSGQTWHSTATLTVVCRSDASAVNVSYQLMTDTAGYGEQGMAGSNGEASYQLYTDGSYRQLWGDTSSSAISDSYALAANSTLSRVYTVYARMQPGRRVGPGQYLAIRGVRLVY